MKKIKMIALTGILLSSTILGANTTVAQASSNKALSVDKTEIANNVIQVINELLNSSSTASNVNSQMKFSDLEDGQTMYVAPIFGQKTDTQFDNVLQGELNVVDSNEQLVPMTTSNKDSNGFPKTVKYTLNGVTKTITVIYNYARPIVSFTNNSQVMNFKDGDTGIENTAENSDVKAISSNGADANGKENTATVSGKMSSDGKTVTFTPKDNYITGIKAKRTVNTYKEPDWSILNNRTITNASDINNPIVIKDSNGNSYLVKATGYTNSNETSSTVNDVTYVATAIDGAGNTVTSDASGEEITFTDPDIENVKVDSSSVNPIITFKDKTTKKVLGTYMPSTGTETIAAGDIQGAMPENSTISGTINDFTPTTSDYTKTYYVTRSANTDVKFVSVVGDNPTNSTTTLNGNDGDTVLLTGIPEGYELVNKEDMLQKLNASIPSKNIYVKPKADSNSLNYTVTFRDKTTGKVVGTESKGTGDFGSYVGVTAPDGYALATVIDHGFILLKNDQKVTKYVVAADTPYNISYVDQDTGEEVGTQSGKGANESKIVLNAPTGYAFVNADDINYTIDKDTPTSTVYVQKSDQTVDNIVSGYPHNGNIKIYDGNGKLNDDVVLSEGSSWIIDKTVTINGAEYYRVATNEYVKASDVYKYTPLQTVAVTNGTNVTPVYNSKGQLIIDRALDVNTPWYTDRSATIRGKKMYRVATDEWIKASDSTLR